MQKRDERKEQEKKIKIRKKEEYLKRKEEMKLYD